MPVARDVAIRGMEGEIFKVVVRTTHPSSTYGNIEACTAVHDQLFQRRIGGVRFVPGEAPKNFEDLTELGELAEAMTWKSPLSGIPADGEKTVVYCPNGFPDPKEQSQILAQHLAVLKQADPGVIFGPDIRCGEDVMERLAHLHGLGEHVSGLPQGKGGLSIDEQGYTARGLEAALVAVADHLGWDLTEMSAIVQGFGAVGAHTANNLYQRGVRIQAVCTIDGSLIATNKEGLQVGPLFDIWKRDGDEAFRRSLTNPPPGSRVGAPDDIWLQKAEILVPAARTDVLATPHEIEGLRQRGIHPPHDIAAVIATSGVKVLLEGANHPLTHAAELLLESHGAHVLPDYLVNCGGLIGCWADWVYRDDLEGDNKLSHFGRLNDLTPKAVTAVVQRNVPRVLERNSLNRNGMREATRSLAKDLRQSLFSRLSHLDTASTKHLPGSHGARLSMDELLESATQNPGTPT